jgi:thiosulfate/3-mercaptopyruvate sulfurtransferase
MEQAWARLRCGHHRYLSWIPSMPLAQLISADQLAARLGEANLVILDCRFALDDPQLGRRSYQAGHIPGAQFADLEEDLSNPVQPGVTGRHPLPEADALIQRLRAWGLNNASDVVLYDDGAGAFAARAWWLLAWLGRRERVWLLDSGFKAWQDASLPLEQQQTRAQPGDFNGQPDPSLLVSAEQLLQTPEAFALLDARGLPRFRGEVEPIDPVAGHIPGAQCVPFTDNLAADGRFLPAEQLAARFDAMLRDQSGETVAYCGSGVTACHNLFAMALAGLPLAKLYAGSWSEWICDPTRPVARG